MTAAAAAAAEDVLWYCDKAAQPCCAALSITAHGGQHLLSVLLLLTGFQNRQGLCCVWQAGSVGGYFGNGSVAARCCAVLPTLAYGWPCGCTVALCVRRALTIGICNACSRTKGCRSCFCTVLLQHISVPLPQWVLACLLSGMCVCACVTRWECVCCAFVCCGM